MEVSLPRLLRGISCLVNCCVYVLWPTRAAKFHCRADAERDNSRSNKANEQTTSSRQHLYETLVSSACMARLNEAPLAGESVDSRMCTINIGTDEQELTYREQSSDAL